MNGILHKPKDLILDRYEIVEYVGEGGMQEVYLAKDLVLQRNIALKSPKNPSATKRFKHSASLSAKVNHPNVAKTLDYFEIEEGPYLIEEFIDGRDLKKVLSNEFEIIDPYLAARLLHHFSKGVAASHHAGVVHRDLKPSNIMIALGYDFSKIKITDFGIAKMAEEEMAEAATEGDKTSSQTMVGAWPYMAPEMLMNPRKASFPADIWSLCAMMYEVVSGKKPFGAGPPAVFNILSGVLPARPQVDAKIQFKTLFDKLLEIIFSCLIKDPTQRPSAEEIVKKCETLCYPSVERKIGVVDKIRYNAWGFLTEGSGQIFFHMASVYGPTLKKGNKVCFSSFPGTPRPRAHPVILMRE